jgi:hypothetical protein
VIDLSIRELPCSQGSVRRICASSFFWGGAARPAAARPRIHIIKLGTFLVKPMDAKSLNPFTAHRIL